MAKRSKRGNKVKVRAESRAQRRAALAPAPAQAEPSTERGRPLMIAPRTFTRLLLLALVLWLLWSLSGLFMTFLLAAALTFIGGPTVRFLQGKGLPRAAGATVFMLALILALVALSMLVLPTLVEELTALIKKLPAALKAAESAVENLTGVAVPHSLSDLSKRLSDDMLGQATSMIQSGGSAVSQGALSVVSGVGRALGAAGQAVMIPVLAFFMLVELPEIRRFIVGFIPSDRRPRSAEAMRRVRIALTSLLRGQLIVAGLMAVIYGIGLSVAGVPLALAIAIISGAGYLIPFASATICVALSAAFCLLELGADAGWPLLGAVITALAVQLLEGWILTPRVVGEQAGLSPLAVILAVLVFGSLFDFLGVLFALPAATVLAVLLDFFRDAGGSPVRGTTANATGDL